MQTGAGRAQYSLLPKARWSQCPSPTVHSIIQFAGGGGELTEHKTASAQKVAWNQSAFKPNFHIQ